MENPKDLCKQQRCQACQKNWEDITFFYPGKHLVKHSKIDKLSMFLCKQNSLIWFIRSLFSVRVIVYHLFLTAWVTPPSSHSDHKVCGICGHFHLFYLVEDHPTKLSCHYLADLIAPWLRTPACRWELVKSPPPKHIILYRRYPLIIGHAVLGNKKTDQHSQNLGDGDGDRDSLNFKKSRMKSHPTYLPWSHDVFRRVVLGWAAGFSFKPQPCHPQLFQIFPFFDPKDLHAQIKKTHVN